MNKLKSFKRFITGKFSSGSNFRFIFFSVLSIILVSTLLWGSTYSLFVSSNIGEDLNVYKTGNLDITYTLSSANVTLSGKTPTSEEDAVTIKPYRITVTNNGNVPYKFNVILTDTTATNAINHSYLMTQVGKLSSIRLSECTDNIIKSDIVVPAGESVIVDVRVWLAEDTANTEIGKSFFGSLTIDGIAVYNDNKNIDNSNLIAQYGFNASSYIMNLYNSSEATTVHINGDSSKPTVSLDEVSNIMLDNNGEYRYYGAAPNNYVEFNGELWRIIAVSNVKTTEADTEGSMRIKIIRDESIGDHSWAVSGVNKWNLSSLNDLLNGIYYNRVSGSCYLNGTTTTCDYKNGDVKGLNLNARKLIDNAVWYLSGKDDSYRYAYADDWYTSERGSDGWGAANTTGIVGLMYPSDWGYAADLSKCTGSQLAFYSDNKNCIETNWLYKSEDNQWTITRYAGEYGAFYIHNGGYLTAFTNMNATQNSLAVFPVVYLKSSVLITGGDGSSGNPYKLMSNEEKYLNEVEPGSYVKYVGSGGTVGSASVSCQTNGSASSSTVTAETEAPNSCSGQNAREDIDTTEGTYGYCYTSSYKYSVTGWRVAYIDSNNKPVIVSAGSPECNNRTVSTDNVTHIQTANAKALKYCNTDYVDGDCTCPDSNADGLCDSTSNDAWAINDTDFYYMTKAISGVGKRLADGSSSLGDSGGNAGLYCAGYVDKTCGYGNDLIDNGGYYWFASQYSSSSTSGVYWIPDYNSVNGDSSTYAYGLRPVITLSSSVKVIDGTGTMADPYVISK